jgi:hypothetical protein
MINTERYIELSDAVLRELATIQANSVEEWFARAHDVTEVVDIHTFKTLWQELYDYGKEMQYIQQREADSDLYDCYESRLQHIVILGQRIQQLANKFGVEYK